MVVSSGDDPLEGPEGTEAGGIQDNPEFVSLMTSLFSLESKLILVDKLGTRSPAAVEVLFNAGFKDVRDLEGGYKGMESVGMPATMTDDASYAQALAEARASLNKK